MGPPSAAEILDRSIEAHGGDLAEREREVSYSITGEWGKLITKIQPLVTDFEYRIDSQEVYRPREEWYRVTWQGPAGEKVVERDRDEGDIRVFYNGEESLNDDVLASSALTSDAFTLFHFGPSLLRRWADPPQRLEDVVIEGRRYYQLYFVLEPGFGRSERDEVVALFDSETLLMHRVWITLEGYRTTQGATVDVTFLGYDTKEGITLPVEFVERVWAPIAIKAHEWRCVEWNVERAR